LEQTPVPLHRPFRVSPNPTSSHFCREDLAFPIFVEKIKDPAAIPNTCKRLPATTCRTNLGSRSAAHPHRSNGSLDTKCWNRLPPSLFRRIVRVHRRSLTDDQALDSPAPITIPRINPR